MSYYRYPGSQSYGLNRLARECIAGLGFVQALLSGLGLFIILAGPRLSYACPALLYPQRDFPEIEGKRKDLSLFTWHQKRKKWLRLPVQTDLMSSKGGLLFGRKPGWKDAPIGPYERVLFDVKAFGRPTGNRPLPCVGSKSYIIRDYNDLSRGAVLTNCANHLKEEKTDRIFFQPRKKRLYSRNYSYTFNKSNAMLFHSVFMTGSTRRFLAAFHSDINIYSEIPGFFDLHFGAGSIESEISSVYEGVLGINANVSFFVRVLFLRLQLSLSTDVSFYKDAAYIPMVLYLPVDPKNYLAEHSGIVYSWASSELFIKSTRGIKMPVFDQKTSGFLESDFEQYKKLGRAFCRQKNWCHFSLEVGFMGRLFTMQFSIPPGLVARGFFPVYVDHPSGIYKQLGWEFKSGFSGGGREGVFFATAGLDAGNSSWDFWLRLGGNKAFRGGLCPYPVTVVPAR